MKYITCTACGRTVPEYYEWHVCMPAKKDRARAALIDPGVALAQKGGSDDRDTRMVPDRRSRSARAGRVAPTHRALTLCALVVVLVVVGLCAAPTAQAGDRPARPSDTGAVVTRVQTVLASYGYTVAIDGHYGPQTERAVRHWQRANRLTVDGIIGPQTLASLDMSEATASGPAPAAAEPGPAVDARMPETIEQTIRDVWPDDLEDRAVAIATRESRLQPGARNACCYGLFQIHWQAHRTWLAGIGIVNPTQLLDPRSNAEAAFALYRRDGWGPWAL